MLERRLRRGFSMSARPLDTKLITLVRSMRLLSETARLQSAPFICLRMSGRDRNGSKSGIASPYHTANLSGLVFGCIEADFASK